MQGRSFAGALKGGRKPADWRTSTYYRYWMHMAHSLEVPAHFGLRTERYKLIFFYGADQQGGNRTPAGVGVLRPAGGSVREPQPDFEPRVSRDHRQAQSGVEAGPRRS